MRALEERPKTINSLLDIEKYSGESGGRMGPMVMFLCVAGAPFLIYVYFFITVIPMTYTIPFFIIHVIRSWMVILGNESARLKQYKQQLWDEYSSVGDIMSIKTVHEDGMVEYTGNKVAYFIVTSNNSHLDPIVRAQMIKKLFIAIPDRFNLSVLGQNVVDSDNLYTRYDGVKFFGDKETARDYLEILDYNRKIIKEDTIVHRTVFVLSSRKQSFKELQSVIRALQNSSEIKAFKTLVVAKKELAEDVISRDIDTFINFEEINKMKYAKETYFGSHVVKYDFKEQKKVKEGVAFKHEQNS